MTAKAKTKKEENKSLDYLSDDYLIVPVADIKPSESITQKARRKRLTEERLNELAESIRKHGVIEPVIIRSVKTGYELVAGERRWKASKLAGAELIPAILRKLSDDEVLDSQIHENLHRENPHPLDEAVAYKYLADEKKLSIAEVSLRVGKSETFVHQRLKLNELIPEALEDLSTGTLPIRHALEIAKYDVEQQKLIFSELLYKFGSKDNGANRFQDLKAEIDKKIKLELKRAPFSLKSKDLRKDSRACTECPERTGANPTLFGLSETGKNDNCLNPACFKDKYFEHVKIQRKAIAKERKLRSFKDVPVILQSSYVSVDEYPDALQNRGSGNPTFMLIDSEKSKCEFNETAVWVEGKLMGKNQEICRKPKCKKHFSSGSSNSKGGISSQKELERKRIRKEELLDIKVREPIRKEVFAAATNLFDEKTWFFDDNPQRSRMVARLLYYEFKDSKSRFDLICECLGFDPSEIHRNNYWMEREHLDEFCRKLKPAQLSKFLFLAMQAEDGEMINANNYTSQEQVREIAKLAGFDYRLADAENRLAQSTKKNKPIFEEYLEKIKSGKKAKIPRVYSEEYVEKP